MSKNVKDGSGPLTMEESWERLGIINERDQIAFAILKDPDATRFEVLSAQAHFDVSAGRVKPL